ncbi:MAG: RNase III inhibitor [Lachnospiraceae bacterium]|nr:RNase III inhibitor [Lachnospiraceae bacterium]
MPFKIVRNDLTKMQVDAIVNTANPKPKYSSGTDTAVYKAAGEEELLVERKKIGYMNEGEVAITLGFKLPAKYIIHAVSPRYINGISGEEKRLRDCYKKSLALAAQYECKSIAFPLIATGSFGYPKEEGMRIALDEINAFLMKQDMLVYLVVFDTAATKLGLNLYPDLKAYIDHNYVCDKREEEYGDRYFGSVRSDEPGYDTYRRERADLETKVKNASKNVQIGVSVEMLSCQSIRRELSVADSLGECAMAPSALCAPIQKESEAFDEFDDAYYDFLEEHESALEERMKHMSDTFQEYLMYLIGIKKLTNAEVYKKAIVTKQLFSKIKLNPDYHPDKATAMRLCVGARLNLDETKDLLARAGYALSPCDKRDIIFSFFIEHEVFDMIEIDIALEEHGLPCFID